MYTYSSTSLFIHSFRPLAPSFTHPYAVPSSILPMYLFIRLCIYLSISFSLIPSLPHPPNVSSSSLSMYPFIHLLIYSSISCSLTHSSTYRLLLLFSAYVSTHPPLNSFIYLVFSHSLTHSPTHRLFLVSVHVSVHPPLYLFIHFLLSLRHSLTHLPSLPPPPPSSVLPAAASLPSSGDCTFEEDTCGWTNPDSRQRVDNLQYLRVRASEFSFPTTDHSTGSRQGEWRGRRGASRLYSDPLYLPVFFSFSSSVLPSVIFKRQKSQCL